MRTTGRPAADKSFAHLRHSHRFKRGQESVWPAAAVSQTSSPSPPLPFPFFLLKEEMKSSGLNVRPEEKYLERLPRQLRVKHNRRSSLVDS